MGGEVGRARVSEGVEMWEVGRAPARGIARSRRVETWRRLAETRARRINADRAKVARARVRMGAAARQVDAKKPRRIPENASTGRRQGGAKGGAFARVETPETSARRGRGGRVASLRSFRVARGMVARQNMPMCDETGEFYEILRDSCARHIVAMRRGVFQMDDISTRAKKNYPPPPTYH